VLSPKVKCEGRTTNGNVEAWANDDGAAESIYEGFVRQAIERGLADSDAGHTKPVEQVHARYGLEP
jgi:hypothetical protein